MRGGVLLIAAALLLAGWNLWDAWRAGEAARQALAQLPEGSGPEAARGNGTGEQELPDYILNPDMEMPVVEIDGNDYIGVLDIPAAGLSLPVMSGWSYEKLKLSPCRYAGTAYQSGFVIAGHNYRRHFTPIKSLAAGTEVYFTDVDGNEFSYEVMDLEVLQPEETEVMTDAQWDLTLFTCTYGGGSRLAVRCVRTDSGGHYGGTEEGYIGGYAETSRL